MRSTQRRRIGGASVAILLAVGLTVGSSVPAQAATVSTTITLKRTSTAEPIAGTYVKFSGTTPASLVGKTLTLQRKVDGQNTWVKVGTAKVAANKTFTTKGSASGPGKNYWRVSYTANSKTQQSAPLSTKVFAWFYLSALAPVSGGWRSGLVDIGSRSYSKSLYTSLYYSSTTSMSEYNLSYKCKLFTATVGLSNNSASNARVNFSTVIDGATRPLLDNVGVGVGKEVARNVVGKFRLGLEVAKTAGGQSSTYASLGNARLLCSAKP